MTNATKGSDNPLQNTLHELQKSLLSKCREHSMYQKYDYLVKSNKCQNKSNLVRIGSILFGIRSEFCAFV